MSPKANGSQTHEQENWEDRPGDCRSLASIMKKHRIALERTIAFIDEHYQPIGTIASGTIILGTAHPSSDLDMVVPTFPVGDNVTNAGRTAFLSKSNGRYSVMSSQGAR